MANETDDVNARIAPTIRHDTLGSALGPSDRAELAARAAAAQSRSRALAERIAAMPGSGAQWSAAHAARRNAQAVRSIFDRTDDADPSVSIAAGSNRRAMVSAALDIVERDLGCAEDAAFKELVQLARGHGVPVLGMAASIVAAGRLPSGERGSSVRQAFSPREEAT